MSFGVSPQKENALLKAMAELGIREEDLVEKFIRGSGKGGQKINKTSSCVYLRHEPSGIEVKCQRERSQALNRYYARKELCSKLDTRLRGAASKKRQQIEKVRRQKRKRSKRAKEKMLEGKAHRSGIKASRKKPTTD